MKNLFKTTLVILAALAVTACSSASERDEMGPMQGQGGGRMEQGQNMGGGMQHPEFEKISEDDFYAGLNLNSEVEAELKVILDAFKEELDSKIKGSNRPPQKSEMDKLISARDEKVEPLLTTEQYAIYKETVEGLFVPDERPQMRQQ